MKQFVPFIIVTIIFTGFVSVATSQDDEATPTPTPVPFTSSCISSGVEPQNILINGNFEASSGSGTFPVGWEPGASGIGGILRGEVNPGTETFNHFVTFSSNASIMQTFSPYTGNYTRFQVRLCGVVTNGRLEIYLGGNLRGTFPQGTNEGLTSGLFTTQQQLPLEIGLGSSDTNRTIEIRYTGGGTAYVDNVQLVPVIGKGGEEPTTPTPTPPEPTPQPTQPPGPTATHTPTIPVGTATPTPTPALVAGSLQISANPPMLSVSPDDFDNQSGLSKQVLLDFEVIGSNGEPIDLGQFEDVRVRITTDEGNIQQYENNNYNSVTGWEDYDEIRASPLYYFPTGPYDGTIRVVIDLQFRTPGGDLQEIRGVLPLIQRVEKESSLIGPTGSFNPAMNYASGRKPGDRGYRPDMRTNLYFKERLD